MSGPAPIEAWPEAVEATLRAECRVLRTATVLRETASTQDAAQAAGASPGAVVVAWRQTRGRGRLGRAWLDTGEEGVALTAVVPAAAPERLIMASAVAVAEAVARAVPAPASIKWPNDVWVRGRKIAGVLVEQSAGRALVGVGVNVGQREFPPQVADAATSVVLEGGSSDRLPVLQGVLAALDRWMLAEEADLVAAYRARDGLRGLPAAFDTPRGRVRGVVISVDPRRGIEVDTATGRHFLPAATTTVVPLSYPSRYGGADVRKT
jgi:BirA family biotin operon repressor/biotin-[acetyl-CoA-carboxylase] ligase